MKCLDDSRVLAFVEGRLDAPARDETTRHLDACDDCRSLVAEVARSATDRDLDRATTDGTAAYDPTEPAPPVVPRDDDDAVPTFVAPGRTIDGKYRIERVLGAGGMGYVLAARHLRLDQEVAIKCLRQEALASPQAVQRFLREAQAVARLKSDHVVRVFDVGSLPNGEPYMVMELLDGSDLQRVVRRRGRLDVQEAVDVLMQACEALAHAHAAGIVHRDLKPANMLVVDRPGRRPLVKLVDFGISKVRRGVGGSNVDVATTGDVAMGTPLYMSPEQLRSAGSVDERCDVWALGAILHELLTGSPPFEAPTVMQLCLRIAEDPPAPIDSIRSDVPPTLARVVQRCLAKMPEDRPPNVAALAHALAPFASPACGALVDAIVPIVARETRRSDAIVPTGTAGDSAAPTTRVTFAAQDTPALLAEAAPRPSKVRWAFGAAGVAAAVIIIAWLAAPTRAPSVPNAVASDTLATSAPSPDADRNAPPLPPPTTVTSTSAEPPAAEPGRPIRAAIAAVPKRSTASSASAPPLPLPAARPSAAAPPAGSVTSAPMDHPEFGERR